MSIILKSGSSGNLANIDSLGNLYVLNSPAAVVKTDTAWTSATLINATEDLLTTGGYPAIVLQLNQTSTITGGEITFEGTFDGINWVTLPVAQTLDATLFVPQTNPYTLQDGTNKTWLIIVQGYQQVRYRLSVVITGTGTVTPYWSLQAVNPMAVSGIVTVAGTVSTTNASIGVTGVASPTSATLMGADRSGTLIPLSVDGSGFLLVSVEQLAAGPIAVTQSTNPWVTDNASTETPLGNATDPVNVVPLAVYTGAGTGYLTVNGVNDGSGHAFLALASTANSGSPPASALGDMVLGFDGTDARFLSTDSSGNVNVNVVNTPAVTVTSGTITVSNSSFDATASGTALTATGSSLNVNITGGSSSGTQYADDAASGATPTGTLAMGWDSAGSKVRALKVDASQNLLITVANTTLAVTQSTSPWVVSGTVAFSNTTIAVTNTGTFAVQDSAAESSLATIAGAVSGGKVLVTTDPITFASPQHVIVDSGAITVSGTVAFSNTTIAVTNTGTFAVQDSAAEASLATLAGTVSGSKILVTADPVTFASPQHVIVDSGAITVSGTVAFSNTTIAVTNTGTFAVQAACTQSTSPWVVSLASTTITGTVGVTQSTSPWIVAGGGAAGTAATGVVTIQGIAAMTPVQVSQSTAANLNATVVPGGSAIFEVSPTTAANTKTNPFFVALTDGTNVITAAMSAWGTAPTGTEVQGVNAELFAGSAALTATSNALDVNIKSVSAPNATGTVGSAAPTTAILTGGSDGTTLRAIATDAGGQVKVLVENSPAITITSGTVSATQGTSPWVVSNSGTFAVQSSIADGADVTQGAKADARSTATDTTAISIMSVLKEISFMEQNPASRAVTNAGTFAVQAAVVSVSATGSAVPADADYLGVIATTAYPTAATAGNLTGVMGDKAGRPCVVLNTVRDLLGTFSVQSTSASPATLIGAGSTGVFNDITELVLTNESATATIVSISDGTTTFKFALAGNGGLTKSFVNPLVQAGSATNWTVSNSAAVNVNCVGVYAKNK